MKKIIKIIIINSIGASILFSSERSTLEYQRLELEVNRLKQSIGELRRSSDDLHSRDLKDQEANAADRSRLESSIKEIKTDQEGNERSGFQLAGYAAFDWTDTLGGTDEFSGVKFAPIFHYQYGSMFQFEGELEITIDEEGETNTELEYAPGILYDLTKSSQNINTI